MAIGEHETPLDFLLDVMREIPKTRKGVITLLEKHGFNENDYALQRCAGRAHHRHPMGDFFGFTPSRKPASSSSTPMAEDPASGCGKVRREAVRLPEPLLATADEVIE